MRHTRPPTTSYSLSVVFFIIFICIATISVIDEIDTDKNSNTQENIIVQLIPVPHVQNEIVVPINGASNYDAQLVNINITLLPDSIIQDFITDGWTIYVTGTDIDNDNNADAFVYGRTFYDDKCIIVENTEIGMQCQSVLHEFGHYIDYKYGFSCTDTFMNIYNSDEYNVMQTDMIWTPSTDEPTELFAEGFADYYCSDNLEQTCPHLYTYLSDMLIFFL